MPSTSCAYHRGKVSLSPAVTRMPYGSADWRISDAKSRASVSPARDAVSRLPASGISASNSRGVAKRQRRSGSGSRSSSHSAAHSISVASPKPTQTPHSANDVMKK